MQESRRSQRSVRSRIAKCRSVSARKQHDLRAARDWYAAHEKNPDAVWTNPHRLVACALRCVLQCQYASRANENDELFLDTATLENLKALAARRHKGNAAHLTQHVVPFVPVRQFVLSFPYWLRYHLA